MTFESDVAAITSRSLWVRARDRAEASGTAISGFLDYDGAAIAAGRWDVTAPQVSTTSPPPLSGKSFYFNTLSPFTCGRVVMVGMVSLFASSTLSGTSTQMAFNGSSLQQEFWASNSTTSGHIGAQWGTAFASTGYTLWGRPDTPSQTPTAWTFEGSNDGTSWTVLDTRTGQTAPDGVHYTFSNTTAYNRYRLNVTAVNGGGLIALSRFDIDGAPTRTNHGGSSGEYWVVRKTAAAGSNCPGPMQTGTAAESYTPLSDGKVYYQVGSSTRADGITNSVAWSSWHIERYVKDSTGVMALWVKPAGGSWSMVHSSNTGAASWASVLVLGASFVTQSNDLQAEWIHFNAALTASATTAPTTGDALKVSDYLTDTHFSAVTPSGVTGTLAGTAPLAVGSLTGTAPTGGTLAGTAPLPTGSLTGTAPTTGTLGGTAPLGVGSMTGATDNTTTGTLAGTAPTPAGSLDGTVTSGSTIGTIAGAAPMGVGAIAGDTGDLEAEATLFDNVVLEDLLYVELTPAADLDVAVPILSEKNPAPVLTDALPAHQRWVDYTPTTEVVGFAHIWVDDVDITYWRGGQTLVRNWTKEAPWGDKAALWEMPQLDPWDVPGEGDLSFIRKGARVVIGIVDDVTGEVDRKWSGFYHSRSKTFGDAETYVYEAHGTMWAAMFQATEPVPYQPPVDIGVLIPRMLNGLIGKPFHDIPQTITGLPTRYRGSRDEKVWQSIQNILAKDGWTADGRQWTLRQVADDEFRLVLKKPMSEIAGTVAWGNPGVDFDVTIDEDSRVDGVFCRWVNPGGGESANVKYPGLELLNGLPYPNADAGVFLNLGTTDADTTSGTGVTDWQRKAIEQGFGDGLRVSGVMTAAWVAVVREVQRALHLTVDGSIGPQTWTATFTTVDESIDLTPRRLPMAVKPNAWPTIDGANGQILGPNPDFDGLPPNYVYLDMGTNITRAEVAKAAQTYLDVNGEAVVTGTAQLRGCLDDLARTDLDLGDNIQSRGFEGRDLALQVGRLSVDLDSSEGAYVVSVDADERARDALTIDQILERNRDALPDPARRPGNPNRSSRLVRDEGFSWDFDSPCGRLPRTAVNGDTGLWSRRVIPFAEVGQLSGIRLHSTVPFAMMLMASLRFSENMARNLVGNPFASTDPYRPHWATLEQYGILGAWGAQGDACGYSGGQESDGYGFTGDFFENTTLEYVTETGPYVSVLLYARGTSGFVWGFEDGDGFLPARQT